MAGTDNFLATAPLLSKAKDESNPLIAGAKLATSPHDGAQEETEAIPSWWKWPMNFEQGLPVLSFDLLLHRSYRCPRSVSWELSVYMSVRIYKQTGKKLKQAFRESLFLQASPGR